MELDEQSQQESDYENELDEDDGHYKEAIPPAPKLQGTIPRSNSNATQTITSKNGSTANDGNQSDSVEHERSFSEGTFIPLNCVSSSSELEVRFSGKKCLFFEIFEKCDFIDEFETFSRF